MQFLSFVGVVIGLALLATNINSITSTVHQLGLDNSLPINPEAALDPLKKPVESPLWVFIIIVVGAFLVGRF